MRWRRGDQAVSIDVMSGIARPAATAPPPLAITYKDRHWDIDQIEGTLVARAQGKIAWRTERPYGPLLGSVWLRQQPPMVRTVSIGGRAGEQELRLNDLDVSGSMNGAVSLDTVPGIGLLAHATSPVGDVALVVRLDKTLKHDFIAGYAAT